MQKINGDIKTLCAIANVTRSGYYRWVKYANTADRDYGDYLLIKEIFEKGKSKLGWRSIQMKLFSTKKIAMNHKKIQRIQGNLCTLGTRLKTNIG